MRLAKLIIIGCLLLSVSPTYGRQAASGLDSTEYKFLKWLNESGLDSASIAFLQDENVALKSDVELYKARLRPENSTMEYVQWGLIVISIILPILMTGRSRFGYSSSGERRPIIELNTLVKAFNIWQGNAFRPEMSKQEISYQVKKDLGPWLEEKIAELKSKVDSDGSHYVLNQVTEDQPEEVESRDLSSNVMYFSSPDRNGFFVIGGNKNFQLKPDSVFKLVIDPSDSHKAEFEFIEQHEAILKAIKFPEDYIHPVCIDKRSYHSKAKLVKATANGKAVLRNDQWIVVKKAIITYS